MNLPPDKRFFDNLIKVLILIAATGFLVYLGQLEQAVQPVNH